MDLTHRFTVPASIDVAWDAFNDLESIAPCFPGASLTSFDGELFEGLVKVKLGPISLQYTGSGRFVERDEAAHRAVIEAKGKDKRGNGTASAGITAELADAGGGATDVTVITDLTITGRPAQFGRGVIQDVSDKLLGQFTDCLETKLGAEPGAGEVAAAGEPAAGMTASATGATVADQAAEKAESSEQPSSASEPAPATASESTAAGAPAGELDLGSTVLPVLLRRYGPYLIVFLVVAFIVRKALGRRS